MPEDPTMPGYRPEYTGDSHDLGPVGSGREFGANLYYLYRAGRNELPAVAEIYSECTWAVHDVTGYLRALLDLPSRGLDSASLRLLELRDEVHYALRETAQCMEAVGEALVQTATDYVVTDEEAVAAFSEKLDTHADEFDDPPPRVPPPPAIGSPSRSELQTDRGRLAAAELAAAEEG